MGLQGLYSHLYQMNYKAIESTINTDANASKENFAGHMENTGGVDPAVVSPKIKHRDLVESRISSRKQKVAVS